VTAPTRRPRTGPPTARRLAIDCLVAVDGGLRANVVVPAALDTSHLEERDRALVTELVYGVCRMRRACDWLIDRHVRGRTDPQVRAALRLGTYQLVWLRVPTHAAVSATVEEVTGPGRSLVNAVLRKVATEADRGPVRWPDPATELSYPDWIVARLAADLGPERARAALETMNRAAEVTVRSDGYIQDRASQLVATEVGATAGERILDLCAAPGGKATAMATAPVPDPDPVPGTGTRTGTGTVPGTAGPDLVVAADMSLERARVVHINGARLGLERMATVVADGTRPPWRPGSFDRVLVDAPCSGLGVLRRRPDARWRVQPDDLARLAALQRRLLVSARTLVRPGGTLVYSVCTLSLVETSAIDRWLATDHADLVPLPPPGAPWEAVGRGARLLPQSEGTDGMYLLRLRLPGGP
jgi:16S rRNA (cytosine967-C5)-methyltransferase